MHELLFKHARDPIIILKYRSPGFFIECSNNSYRSDITATAGITDGEKFTPAHKDLATFSESDREKLFHTIHKAICSNGPECISRIEAHRRRDKDPIIEKKYYSIEINPLSNSGFISVCFKDITSAVLLETEKTQLEKGYVDLFEFNPLPMWIYEKGSTRFLQVNKAAIAHYGYSAEEFRTMTLRDICPSEDIEGLERVTSIAADSRLYVPGKFRHRKKSGETIYVDLYSSPIHFKNKDAKIVIVHDLTEQTEYFARIEQQNEALREIAHIQSHSVRAPLARIMGFVRLLTHGFVDQQDQGRILSLLTNSADDLDALIWQIIQRTNETSGHPAKPAITLKLIPERSSPLVRKPDTRRHVSVRA